VDAEEDEFVLFNKGITIMNGFREIVFMDRIAEQHFPCDQLAEIMAKSD